MLSCEKLVCVFVFLFKLIAFWCAASAELEQALMQPGMSMVLTVSRPATVHAVSYLQCHCVQPLWQLPVVHPQLVTVDGAAGGHHHTLPAMAVGMMQHTPQQCMLTVLLRATKH
jgi:hypothetical protein